MAGIDYGVLCIKNGELLTEIDDNVYVAQGCAGTYFNPEIGITFDRVHAYSSTRKTLFTDWVDNEPEFVINFSDYLYSHGIWVYKWSYNNVQFKTKRINERIFQTDFTFNGDHYHVLQGYDISLTSFWERDTCKIVNKFLNKYVDDTVCLGKVIKK